MLQVQNIEMRFGGVQALSGISFEVPPGSIMAVIGPNGAGKTTLFNVISGLYRPTSGSVLWEGQDLTRVGPHRLAGLGVARTFQNPQVFEGATALQTVQIGSHRFAHRGLISALFRLPAYRREERTLRERSLEWLDFVGLADAADMPAAEQSYGAIKRLDLARAIASEPRLLLMDEPAAGLNGAETEQLKRMIQAIAARGITVLLVEHDMKLVMEISHSIVVLNLGQELARGTPAQIRSNPSVLAAYLGAESLEAA
ncbi:ABC transporter ATP-binding protein [Ottowia thiooxydans]|uniref:Branched-chain amino acid transport system ATP-binding protein n=1 Tax=Ottowia thiooxydans TaxID=219182 RepID=A0ABV2Q217_9BURK